MDKVINLKPDTKDEDIIAQKAIKETYEENKNR